jgi:cobalt-zinc-cadmium efflux system outer membrane protein
LRIPPELPGSEAQLPQLPSDPAQQAERLRILKELFPELPPLGDETLPTGTSITLAEMQRLGMQHPGLRQARADVEAARGAAVQAGLPPNPSFGFEADTVGSGATAGQQGAKIEQLIKTAGKLKLAQAAALMDVVRSQIALRRAELDRAAAIRGAYFTVLIAEENVIIARALAQLTDEVFNVTVATVRGGQAAPYEPFQSRALAAQARAVLVQARAQYQSAWRQFAAAVGRPEMAPAPLSGHYDMVPPSLPYEVVRDRMLAVHTDLRTAEATVERSRYNLRLAEVTPIPDVALKVVVQKDFTTPPFFTTANVEVGVPVPVWDRNQGNIQQARGQLAHDLEEAQRARLDLLGRLADAMQRYESNRALVETYRRQTLPDQARAYRGVLLRYQQGLPGEVNFNDVITAQQAFFNSLNNYVTALGAQWQAVVDLIALGQWDDLYPLESKPIELGKE